MLGTHPHLAPKQKRNLAGWWESVRVVVYIASWIICSSITIIFNKWILVATDFHFPMFLTAWHMLFATIVTFILRYFGYITVPVKEGQGRWEYFLTALPIGTFFALSLVLANHAYLHLSVAFVQMIKAATPVAVYCLSVLMKLETFHARAASMIFVISLGVACASYGEINFVLIGFVFQVLAVCFESGRLLSTQFLLTGLKLNPLSNLSLFAPICFIFIAIPCYFFEWPEIYQDGALAKIGWPLLFANAAVAFGLNVAGILVITSTSSIVLTLSGIFKDIMLVASSVLFFGTPITPLQIGGYTVALLGIVLYKQVKDSMAPPAGAGANQKTPPVVASVVAMATTVVGQGGSQRRIKKVEENLALELTPLPPLDDDEDYHDDAAFDPEVGVGVEIGLDGRKRC